MPPFGSGDEGVGDRLRQALERIVDDLEGFATSVEGATRGLRRSADAVTGGLAGFGINTVSKGLKDFNKGVAVQSISDFITFKGDVSFKDTFQAAVKKQLGDLPFVGGAFRQEVKPFESAAQRTIGVTGAIARAGGQVDPQLREAIFSRFTAQEQAAFTEQIEVAKLATRRIASTLPGSASDELGRRIGSALKGIRETTGVDLTVGSLGEGEALAGLTGEFIGLMITKMTNRANVQTQK